LKCPSCGLDNKADNTYCDDCGALLTSSAVVLTQPARFEPLEVGTTVAGRFRIESAEVSGIYNIYQAVATEGEAPVRLIEDAEAVPMAQGESEAPPPADVKAEGADTGPLSEDTVRVKMPKKVDGAPRGDDASRAALLFRALSGLDSPHLWKISDFVYEDTRGFVVGDRLPSETLQERLGSAALEPAEVQALGLSLLEAVGLLHTRGYLHLGVHPANIRLHDEGQAILDGYDRLAPLANLPDKHSVLEGYSAPEAYGIGGQPCAASDVFGVGATLYYALARRVPTQVSREQFFVFPPLSSQVKETPPALERIIMKAVAKDLANRWPTAVDMHEALAQASLEPPPARPAQKPAPQPVTVGASGEGGSASEGAGRATSTAVAAEPRAATATATEGHDTMPAPPLPATGFSPFRIGLKSHVGAVREVNQDSMLVMSFAACERSVPTEALLIIVADGMGGEAEGDKASSLAIRAMAHHVLERNLEIITDAQTIKLKSPNTVDRLEEMLRESIEISNRVIFDYSQKDASRRGMGSTLTAIMIDWPYAVFGHAGDTRAYLLHADSVSTASLDQVTEDHSLVGKLVRLGQLTREEARQSPQRSYLYRALGTSGDLELDVYSRMLTPGDRILVCSDGVWEYFSDDEIVHYLGSNDEPQAAVEALIEEVLRRGADDNCTAVMLYVPK
jgi:protein phosphatase